MSEISQTGARTVRLSAAVRINEVCNRFELAWQAGQRPRIEDYLGDAAEPERSDLVRELVALDIDYRRQAGEHPSEDEYRARFPALAEAPLLEDLATEGGADPKKRTEPLTSQVQSPFPGLPAVPGYEILKELGRGGMGVVYWAWQNSLRRTVALKMIRAGADASPEELARFRLEAEAVSRLQHPNIVQVYEVGQADRCPYLALEFVDGGSLAQRLAGTPLPFKEAARLVELLAQAMHEAHQKGVVHRDLTPANILLQRKSEIPNPKSEAKDSDFEFRISDFEPKVTDFGLAKLFVGGGPTLTHSGVVLGTPSYMAPEQAAGNMKDVGPATDVYALGAILYECLTGRPPFKAATPLETLLQVLSVEPVSPNRLQPKLPRDLTTICLKCLAKEPVKRYASAGELEEDLRRFLAGEPIRARPVGTTERLWRWCQRNPRVAGLLATVALLLVTIAAVSTISAARLSTALGEARAAGRQARLREAEALIGQALGIRYSRRPGQRFETLAPFKKAAKIGRELDQPPDWFDRLRNEAIIALALPDICITESFPGFPAGTYRADLSPDFQLYGRTTEQGGCSIRRVVDDVEIASLSELGEPARVQFGPGGLLVLYGDSSHRLQLWDLTGPAPVRRIPDQRDAEFQCSFSGDGRLFAVGYKDGSIDVYATNTGKLLHHLIARDIAPYPFPALHPTEPVVAVCWYSSRLLQIRDLETGAVRVSLELPWQNSSMCVWSPDGRTLAVSAGETDGGDRTLLYAFDAAARTLSPTPHLLRGESNGGTALAFNPAGDLLATRGWNGKVHLFDVHTGRLLFLTHALPTISTAFLRIDLTGGRLAATRVGTEQEKIGLWSVADGREYRVFSRHGARTNEQLQLGTGTFAIHPGGRLAAKAFTGGLALFDLETGRELAFIKLSAKGGSVCFDGAGNPLTNDYEGCFHWPVRPDPARPGQFTIGPPERLPFKRGNRQIAASRDGKVIAQAMYDGYGMPGSGWILNPKAAGPLEVEPRAGIVYASVHPDGRWVAFGLHTVRVGVYEAATGRTVWPSPADGHFYCRFSSDGRWLVSDADGGRAYAVDTWAPGPPLGPGTPWDVSPDGCLVVLGQTDGTYHLVERATGRELAKLENPDQTAGAALFTPDGTRLVVSSQDGLRVWDLRRIRAGLGELDLDWDAAPYPPAPASAPPPLIVTIKMGDMLQAR
jgi:serine/threonine protein kinase/WD40 repeat protein